GLHDAARGQQKPGAAQAPRRPCIGLLAFGVVFAGELLSPPCHVLVAVVIPGEHLAPVEGWRVSHRLLRRGGGGLVPREEQVHSEQDACPYHRPDERTGQAADRVDLARAGRFNNDGRRCGDLFGGGGGRRRDRKSTRL